MTDAEPEHVNLDDAAEVARLTKQLGITEARLRQLVKDHGTALSDIHKALGR